MSRLIAENGIPLTDLGDIKPAEEEPDIAVVAVVGPALGTWDDRTGPPVTGVLQTLDRISAARTGGRWVPAAIAVIGDIFAPEEESCIAPSTVIGLACSLGEGRA